MTSRQPAVGRVAIAALILALLALLVALAPPEPTLFWDSWFDAGHVPLFGVLALLYRQYLTGRPEPGASLAALGCAVATGAATELAQAWQPDREASLGDLLYDAVGAAAFLLLRFAWSGRGQPTRVAGAQRRAGLAVAAAMLLLALALAPLTARMAAYAARTNGLPVLFPLDGRWWESYFVKTDAALLTPRARSDSTPGRRAARLDLFPAPYAALLLQEPPGDWTRYQRLVFDVWSDLAGAVTLHLRIHDRQHASRYDDRFNTSLVVRPGANRFAIELDAVRDAPAGRTLDLGAIREIVLFAADLREPTHVFLGPVRLE